MILEPNISKCNHLSLTNQTQKVRIYWYSAIYVFLEHIITSLCNKQQTVKCPSYRKYLSEQSRPSSCELIGRASNIYFWIGLWSAYKYLLPVQQSNGSPITSFFFFSSIFFLLHQFMDKVIKPAVQKVHFIFIWFQCCQLYLIIPFFNKVVSSREIPQVLLFEILCRDGNGPGRVQVCAKLNSEFNLVT